MRNGCTHLLSILPSKEIAEVYNLIILELKRNYLSQKTKFKLKKQNTKQCISVQKKVYLN